MLAKRQTPIFVFAFSLLFIYAVDITAARSALFNAKPHLLAVALLIDLALVVPLLYYYCIIRTGRLPLLTIAPVTMFGVLVASIVLPAEATNDLRNIKYLAALPELIIAVYAFSKAKGTLQIYRHTEVASGDFVERLRLSFQKSLGEYAFVEVVVSELAVLYYALFSWRAVAPAPPARTLHFSYHRKSNWASILAALLMIVAAEGFAVHFLIARWSNIAAWVLTASSVYGAVWLIGDYRAMCLRPIRIDEDALHIRLGLRWSARIPLCDIARVDSPGLDFVPQKSSGYLRSTVIGEPELLISLKHENIADGLFGLKKRFRQVGVAPDETGLFEVTLNEYIKTSQGF